MRPRVIPLLLLRGQGLVKGIQFKNHQYVGDPMNAVHIFNEKEVDELIFLDISATAENRTPALDYVEKIADECYMPFAVGGGIRNVQQIRDILHAGAEKVAFSTAAVETPQLISEAAALFGSQSVVVCIEYKGKTVYTHAASRPTKLDVIAWAIQVAELGAGEILLNSIDRDGTRQGYDLDTLQQVAQAVNIPVIACGGAGTIEHLAEALQHGASAVAAGSMFVFHGKHRAVLISYPSQEELNRLPISP